MKYVLFIFLIASLTSCKTSLENTGAYTLKNGFWRVTLTVQDSEQLPFNMEILANGNAVIRNGEERIEVDEIKINEDSIYIQTPIFEGYFAGRFRESGNTITGLFIKPSIDRVVPFKMIYGDSTRFKVLEKDNFSAKERIAIDGGWETIFSPNSKDDRYIAKGIFKQNGTVVTGTFRTTTGDYRYLEGSMNGDELRLSTFDGAHAFLFIAKVTDSTMKGHFYSGNHWKEPFTAVKNEKYELPDANALTFLKEGYDTLAFSFPDKDGNLVSLADDRYKDKVVLVKIMGTWCPNCIEETKFLKEYLQEHPTADLEIISLAFEYAPTEEKAWASIKRLQDRLDIPYPILLAQYGDSDKKTAQEKLPMLNHILSYPTLIFIDKKGNVRRIHTGFNGAATGEKHMGFKKEFKSFLQKLLRE